MTSLKRSVPVDDHNRVYAQKIYFRQTRTGKVQKIVREVYLRKEVWCYSKYCGVCTGSVDGMFGKEMTAAFMHALEWDIPLRFSDYAPVLSANPAATSQYPNGHYLIPDTNAFLSAMDLFEVETAFHDVIVLQIVLEEVKNRSLPLYHRLVSLIKNADKRFAVFWNEFCNETYVERKKGETINDRNDRAVRKAVAWYEQHLQQSAKKSPRCPAVVMLSDDKANLQKAKAEGITSSSLQEYVSGLPNANELLDMVKAGEVDREPRAQLCLSRLLLHV